MDRETVIRDLEYLVSFGGASQQSMVMKIATEALIMLKEHETVEPILKREGRNKYYNDYVCPRCDNEVVYEQNYCSECGVQFLWEGR